jgi:CheY-like chemotaxis protein
MNTNPSAPPKRVLFVDDSPKFLDKVRAKLSVWDGGKWELLTASDTSEAFHILESQQVDLLVVDNLGLSSLDGLQFLKLIHQKHPHIRKAMLTSQTDKNLGRQSFESGANLFLIKPKRSNGLGIVFSALNQLFDIPLEGFRGMLRKVSLPDLIQLDCLNLRSCVLEISAGNQFGQVFIHRGQIIHARAGSKTGVPAFIRLMRMPGGDFHHRTFHEPEARTIEMKCDQLLIEAAHAMDSDTDVLGNPDAASAANTNWFGKSAEKISLDVQSQAMTPATETGSTPMSQSNPSGLDQMRVNGSSETHPEGSSLDNLLVFTSELVNNRAQIDMRVLDLALLKEELNGCKSRLDATIAGIKDRSELASDSTRLAEELTAVSAEESRIVGELDNMFAAFTEESGQFNDISTKLHGEIERLKDSVFAA